MLHSHPASSAGHPWAATAGNRPERGFLGHQLGTTALIEISIDPLLTIGALLACLAALGLAFTGSYLILALIVFSFTFPGSPPKATTPRALAGEILASWAPVVALLLLIGWATRTLQAIDPDVAAAWAIATPAVRFGAHLLLPLVLPRVFSVERVRRNAVIAGGGALARDLAERLRSAPQLGVQVIGCFEDRGPGRASAASPVPNLGNLAALAQYAKTHPVDLIYITLPMASQPRILRLLDELRDTTASIYFVPDIFAFDPIQARIDTIGGMPVVSVCESPFHGVDGLVKRASDLALAALILALVWPLMLAIAIGVKLSSRGPVLFRQRRYGLDGRQIVVYKFRTMTVLEDGATVPQATQDDRRVTRFGAFLRRYSLDELPQFVNVLQGRMSVVGPRPHAVAHNELYRKLIKGYMIRHKVRPGITGWAQVNGLRGETDVLEKMQKRIDYDLAYLRNWSLRLDVWLVLKTVLVIFRSPNAY
ncbi:MAG: undecaprenyl-phosphate glucose phosphotransferase [Betaproteobacteria bacterium]|nr:undecaprenyl-phosphate glucose phosphotransferase [Betaproteobacteria bacterium]